MLSQDMILCLNSGIRFFATFWQNFWLFLVCFNPPFILNIGRCYCHSYGWCYNHILIVMADVDAIFDTLVAIIALWGWCYCLIIVSEADVIASVADGITTFSIDIGWCYCLVKLYCGWCCYHSGWWYCHTGWCYCLFSFYVVDVITTVADVIATRGIDSLNVMCGRWNGHSQQVMSIVVLWC